MLQKIKKIDKLSAIIIILGLIVALSSAFIVKDVFWGENSTNDAASKLRDKESNDVNIDDVKGKTVNKSNGSKDAEDDKGKAKSELYNNSKRGKVSANSTKSISSKNIPKGAKGSSDERDNLKVSLRVEVIIRVDDVNDTILNLNSDKKALVPASGIIARGTADISDGDTAYDALETFCSKKGIPINKVNSFSGMYVRGIGGLNEFDAGSSSGWRYRVNGIIPSEASSKCFLKNGDVMEWFYKNR